VLRRLGAAVLVLVAASLLIFATLQVLPGDVAEVVLGRNATPEAIAAIRQDLNLDQPFLARWWTWFSGILHGDFGNSTTAIAQGQSSAPVWEAIRTPLMNSMVLAIITLTILVPLALLMGRAAARRAGKPTDHAISTSSLVLAALPEFLVGTVLIYIFFTRLHLFPPISQIPEGKSPLAYPNRLVLPVLTLLAVSLAAGTRMVRAGIIDVLGQDYIAMARLNGIPEKRVLHRYAHRNALAPSIQVLAQTVQFLIGGIIVTEAVFAYPGIGSSLVSAVSTRDIQTVMDISIILAAVYVLVNIAADVAVTLLIPKLRTELR
jgi:peptide/nickel transport system permease protein